MTVNHCQHQQLQQLVQDQNELIRELRMEIEDIPGEVAHLRALTSTFEHRLSHPTEPCTAHHS